MKVHLPDVNTVSVVGLGKLGASMAACYAHKGFNVIGVDTNPATVDAINAGTAPVIEPGLHELISSNRARLRATADVGEAVSASTITFIVVPTPSRRDGSFSTEAVVEAGSSIGRALRQKSGYHLVCLTSTVLPGGTGGDLSNALEGSSLKRAGEDFGLCYSPEFIALGQVIHGLLNPDFLLIGESDSASGDTLASFYGSIIENDAPVVGMSLVNAELAKVAINSYVTMKITFANMIAALCEQLPGGDVDAVTGAIGHDSRIGPKYLRGAVGYGGPCFPRDNRALAHLADAIGGDATLPRATDNYNQDVLRRFADSVFEDSGTTKRVAILGMAYKPDTNVVEHAPGLLLAEELVRRGAHVSVFDPIAAETARDRLGGDVHYPATSEEAVDMADVVAVMNPDPLFTTASVIARLAQPTKSVFDGWRLFRDIAEVANKPNYHASGINSHDSTGQAIVRRPQALEGQR